MPSTQQETAVARDMLYALDPVAFAVECLDFKPDPWQANVLRWPSGPAKSVRDNNPAQLAGKGQRLLMNCSRQSGKSTTTAVKALHCALYDAGSLILLVSPSLRQSSELFRKVVDFLNRLDTRPELVEDNRLSIQLANGSRVVSLPGDERTVRGFSAPKLVIEYEASRVPDELNIAIRPMLAVSGGALLLLSTPYGKRGHFFTEWTTGGDSWERVAVKASECPRITPEFLENERRSMGDRFYAQEYDCEFRDTVEQLFATELVEKMFAPSGRTSVFREAERQ